MRTKGGLQNGSEPAWKSVGLMCLSAETRGKEGRRPKESALGARRAWRGSTCRLRARGRGPERRRAAALWPDSNPAALRYTLAGRQLDAGAHLGRSTYGHRDAYASAHPRAALALVRRPTDGRPHPHPHPHRAARRGGLARGRGAGRGARDCARLHNRTGWHGPSAVYGLLSLYRAGPAVVQRDVGMALAIDAPTSLGRRAAGRLAAHGGAKEERRQGVGKTLRLFEAANEAEEDA